MVNSKFYLDKKVFSCLLIVIFLLAFVSGCVNKSNGGVGMNKKIVMIIAPENFRDEELLEPKQVFETAGFNVTVASKSVDEARGMLGAVVKVDKDVSNLNIHDYDAVVFVGGSGAAVYFDDAEILDLAQEAYKSADIIGAICIAPSILANAGLLEGKKATSFPSEKQNLNDKGAIYTGNDVEKDGKIITAVGPSAALKFGEEIRDALLN
ncbi:MAG: DJ-1/PfpI family protein [Candidatus Aenigmarchaeota archaeon]|nr:DJ-1/PfpI family protein [Candidatus Aenigmarchaeota archaeon]